MDEHDRDDSGEERNKSPELRKTIYMMCLKQKPIGSVIFNVILVSNPSLSFSVYLSPCYFLPSEPSARAIEEKWVLMKILMKMHRL